MYKVPVKLSVRRTKRVLYVSVSLKYIFNTDNYKIFVCINIHVLKIYDSETFHPMWPFHKYSQIIQLIYIIWR